MRDSCGKSLLAIFSFFSLMLFSTVSASAAPCPLSSTNPSVTICTPPNGATVTSPVHVVAGTTSSSTVTAMKIYVDNNISYSVNASQIDTQIAMPAGSHYVVVQAWNSAGQVFKSPINITVSSGGTPPPCTLSSTNPSVTICTPANGASVASPVQITAGTTSSSTVTAMKIYVDNTLQYSVNASALNASLPMSSGGHSVVVQAWNSAGQIFKSAVNITVTASSGSGDISKLKHIIFLLQENRSYDNYFGRMGAYRSMKGYSSIEDIPLNKAMPDVSGALVTPFHFQTVCHENLSPSWNETHYAIHNGLMDYFMKSSTSVPSSIDPDGTRAVGYYDWTDLPYYYELALQFAMSDRFFASVQANTNPNRMYMFAATSFGHIKPDSPPAGGWTQPTIFDALDQAGVSWRYYYQDNSIYLASWSTWQRDSGKVHPISSYYTDLQDPATLPSVIFIERAAVTGLDEHPGSNVQTGSANTKKMIDALMNSPSWADSVFFLTFDEPGGLFDHVQPVEMAAPDNIQPMFFSGALPGDFAHSSLRVPFIAISPYVKPHYVSHTAMDLTAILKFIENRFNMPALTARDASQPDLSELFDFSSPTLLTPPPLPAQPTNGLCNFNYEKAPGH